MSGVRLAPIGSAVERVESWTPERDSPDGTFMYIDLSAVDQRGKVVSAPRELACTDAPSRARQLVRSGDVLVSTVRPNLNGVAVVPHELDGATASTGFCVLRPQSGKLSGSYLFHWVKSAAFVSDMVRKATGASYPAISDRIVQESEIPLPPLSEQRRIAAILDKADALRTVRRAAIAQVDRLIQSVFLDLFGNPATNPKGWVKTALGGLISVGPQNGLYKPSSDYGSGTPILRIDAFYDGVVTNLSSLKRVRLSDGELALYRLRPGEIVINRVNSRDYLGKSALIPEYPEPWVFESNMMRFDVDRSRVEPNFLIHFLQTGYVRAQIQQSAKDAVNQSSINQQDVKALPIIVPPLSLQQHFAETAVKIRSVIAHERAHNGGLDELLESLQQLAFSGAL